MEQPKRHAALGGKMVCDRCGGIATYFEFPVPDNEDLIYAACDPCWVEHDKQ